MEFIAEFFQEYLYFRLGKFFFGEDFEKNRTNIPLWKRAFVFALSLVIICVLLFSVIYLFL